MTLKQYVKVERTGCSLLGLEEGVDALALQGFAALGALKGWSAHGSRDRKPLQVFSIVRRAQGRILPAQQKKKLRASVTRGHVPHAPTVRFLTIDPRPSAFQGPEIHQGMFE